MVERVVLGDGADAFKRVVCGRGWGERAVGSLVGEAWWRMSGGRQVGCVGVGWGGVEQGLGEGGGLWGIVACVRPSPMCRPGVGAGTKGDSDEHG